MTEEYSGEYIDDEDTFKGKCLENVRFDGANLEDFDFSGGRFNAASFVGAVVCIEQIRKARSLVCVTGPNCEELGDWS